VNGAKLNVVQNNIGNGLFKKRGLFVAKGLYDGLIINFALKTYSILLVVD
jgi:hypothetical protein